MFSKMEQKTFIIFEKESREMFKTKNVFGLVCWCRAHRRTNSVSQNFLLFLLDFSLQNSTQISFLNQSDPRIKPTTSNPGGSVSTH